MNLRDLEYLVALADERHFGGAAQSCGVSQPTLSAQVRKLEDSLGVELIERGTRPLLLTNAGRQVVERARNILAEADAIENISRDGIDPARGRLSLGFFPSLGPYLLPHVIPTVRRRFPDLHLQLVEEKTETLLKQLHDGDLDAAVLAQPVDDRGFQSQALFDEEFLLAVPRDHALEGGAPVEQTELLGRQILLLDDGHCFRDQALAVCHQAGASEAEFRASSLETLRAMVSARSGVTLLPRLAVSPPVPENPDIRLLPFSDPVPFRRIGLYWRDSSALRGFLRGFADVFIPGADTFEVPGVQPVP